jgi:hypothetical protein
LLDNGFIGADGIARTASKPYDGVYASGQYLVTKKIIDETTGLTEVKVANLERIKTVMWSPVALMAMTMNPIMALSGITTFFAAAGSLFSMRYFELGTYKQEMTGTLNTNTLTFSLPPLPDLVTNTPRISQVEYDVATRELTVTGDNFIPEGQKAGNFDLKVWLVPRGTQIGLPTPTDDATDRGLIWQGFTINPVDASTKITLPKDVALSMHLVYIERIAKGSKPNEQGRTVGLPVDSDPVQLWSLGTANMIATTAHEIVVLSPTPADAPQANELPHLAQDLKARISVNENGETLDLTGSYDEQIVYSNDGALAFIAGNKGKIYVMDNQSLNVVYTLQIVNSTARIGSMAVVDNWLYVAENSPATSAGSRLLRINIDPLDPDYLKEQQVIELGIAVPTYGFKGMAVNNGAYLALAAPENRKSSNLFGGALAKRGNVYIVDLAQIDEHGQLPKTAVLTLDDQALEKALLLTGSQKMSGRYPDMISAGIGDGEFLLSSHLDFDHGVTAIKVNMDKEGHFSQTVEARNNRLGYAPHEITWIWQNYHDNVQTAAGTVTVMYGEPGKEVEYALVADYFENWRDPSYNEQDGYGAGIHMGGKVGIIRDPFNYMPMPPSMSLFLQEAEFIKRY